MDHVVMYVYCLNFVPNWKFDCTTYFILYLLKWITTLIETIIFQSIDWYKIQTRHLWRLVGRPNFLKMRCPMSTWYLVWPKKNCPGLQICKQHFKIHSRMDKIAPRSHSSFLSSFVLCLIMYLFKNRIT